MKLMITGKMGSGKGFAAQRLTHRHGASRWTRTELMKRLAHAIVDQTDNPDIILDRLFDDPELRSEVLTSLFEYGNSYDRESGKPRRLYQDITDICQRFDPLCFEIELDQRIATTDSEFILIDDVRSLPAFEYFTSQGYKSLRINATDQVRKSRMLERDGYLPPEGAFQHPSETALDNTPHNYRVDNNGENLIEFYAQLDRVYEEVSI